MTRLFSLTTDSRLGVHDGDEGPGPLVRRAKVERSESCEHSRSNRAPPTVCAAWTRRARVSSRRTGSRVRVLEVHQCEAEGMARLHAGMTVRRTPSADVTTS